MINDGLREESEITARQSLALFALCCGIWVVVGWLVFGVVALIARLFL